MFHPTAGGQMHHHSSDRMRRDWLVARFPPGAYHETAAGSPSDQRQVGVLGLRCSGGEEHLSAKLL